MAQQTYSVHFNNVAPAERVWVYLCSQNGVKHTQQCTWTDDRNLTVTLVDVPTEGNDGSDTSHTLIAFTRGRQPIWWPIDLNKPQSELHFHDEQGLSIGIWILAGDFERQRQRALNSILVANAILFEENTGLRIDVNEIIDAVDIAKESPLVNGSGWSNVTAVVKEVDDMGSKLSPTKKFRSHYINIFFTDSIGKDPSIHGTRLEGDRNYMTCIALNRYALDDLLLHEIGHALALDDENSSNDRTGPIPIALKSRRNVMQHSSILRRFFTEGQIARMHFSTDSALVDVYDFARPPSMTSWYREAKDAGLIPLDLVLAEERNQDNYPLPPHTDESLAALTDIPGVMVSAMPALRTVETVEAILTSSRERYRLRTRQLHREIQRKFDTHDALMLSQVTMEEYVASDFVRLWEYYQSILTK